METGAAAWHPARQTIASTSIGKSLAILGLLSERVSSHREIPGTSNQPWLPRPARDVGFIGPRREIPATNGAKCEIFGKKRVTRWLVELAQTAIEMPEYSLRLSLLPTMLCSELPKSVSAL